jgi:hypothetical protein
VIFSFHYLKKRTAQKDIFYFSYFAATGGFLATRFGSNSKGAIETRFTLSLSIISFLVCIYFIPAKSK